MKDFNKQMTPHISYGELAKYEDERRFKHQHQCDTAFVLCSFLELVRFHFGGNPIVVTSGYRPPLVNQDVGGSTQSEHLYDQPDTGAIDFYIKDVNIYDVQAFCDEHWPYSLGYGAAKGFIHIGMRPGKPRVRWDY